MGFIMTDQLKAGLHLYSLLFFLPLDYVPTMLPNMYLKQAQTLLDWIKNISTGKFF